MQTNIQTDNNLSNIIKQAHQNHAPVHINSDNMQAVVLSLEYYDCITETLFLSSIPNMKKSIIDGLNTPVEGCSSKPQW
ncbi:MAG: type II toxin-antitoxin system prevent-host-death family antitoxin [Gammaproteobacteria bacterium]|nr:MAG: type II toxin-antitoxin system prevent-host-death family antitoxin [Gammaproteobacteria bacterium]